MRAGREPPILKRSKVPIARKDRNREDNMSRGKKSSSMNSLVCVQNGTNGKQFIEAAHEKSTKTTFFVTVGDDP
jgi:hypothetical protein